MTEYKRMLNQPAPEFSLTASNGKQIHLRDLRRSFVLLVFYPLNDSPTCNCQLSQFSVNMPAFLEANTVVFGVNTAPVNRQREYCTRRQLEFPILSDPGGRVARTYRAQFRWLPFTRRTVVVVDPEGTICFYQRGTPSPEAILDLIQSRISTPVSV